jgi:hypothetical protein
MASNIHGNGKNGQEISVKVGDRVRFDTNSNIGIREDVVRTCFMQTDSLGSTYPAVVLTEHSWTPLSHVMEVLS